MVVEGNNNGYDCLMLLPHILAFFAMPWIQTVRYETAELTAVVPQLSDFNFEQTSAHFDRKKILSICFLFFFNGKGMWHFLIWCPFQLLYCMVCPALFFLLFYSSSSDGSDSEPPSKSAKVGEVDDIEVSVAQDIRLSEDYSSVCQRCRNLISDFMICNSLNRYL